MQLWIVTCQPSHPFTTSGRELMAEGPTFPVSLDTFDKRLATVLYGHQGVLKSYSICYRQVTEVADSSTQGPQPGSQPGSQPCGPRFESRS